MEHFGAAATTWRRAPGARRERDVGRVRRRRPAGGVQRGRAACFAGVAALGAPRRGPARALARGGAGPTGPWARSRWSSPVHGVDVGDYSPLMRT